MSIFSRSVCAAGLVFAGMTHGTAKGMPTIPGNESPVATGIAVPDKQPTAAKKVSGSQEQVLHLPFYIDKGFVFVSGMVDGKAGVFMFDTGNPFTFLLNRDRVPLAEGQVDAKGNAGSGQAVTVHLHQQQHVIRLAGGAVFTPPEIRSGNLGFIAEGLDVPLLGSIGIGLLRDYRFTVDYQRRLATLAPKDSVASSDVKPLAVLRFHHDGHMPKLAIQLGGMSIPAIMDTGAQGSVALTDETRERLVAEGVMRINEEGDSHTIDLHALSYDKLQFDLDRLRDDGKKQDRILLGYSFLHQYRSVWDYDEGTVTLYAAD